MEREERRQRTKTVLVGEGENRSRRRRNAGRFTATQNWTDVGADAPSRTQVRPFAFPSREPARSTSDWRQGVHVGSVIMSCSIAFSTSSRPPIPSLNCA